MQGYKVSRDDRRKTLQQYLGKQRLDHILRGALTDLLEEVPANPIPFLIKCLRKHSGDFSDVEGQVKEALLLSKAEVLKILAEHKASFREDLRAPNVLAWNERYQRLVEKCRSFSTLNPRKGAVEAWMELYHLHQEFETAAEGFTRVIVQEMGLPEHEMTFRPVPAPAGAIFAEYICQGIRLTVFAKESQPIGDAIRTFQLKTLTKGQDDTGLKLLGHELRGLQTFSAVGTDALSLPLFCTVDYRGVRVLATTAVPHPFGFSATTESGSAMPSNDVDVLEKQLEDLILRGRKAGEGGKAAPLLPQVAFSLYNSSMFHQVGHTSKFGLTPRVTDLRKASNAAQACVDSLNIAMSREEWIEGARGFLAKDGRLYFQQHGYILPFEKQEEAGVSGLPSARPSTVSDAPLYDNEVAKGEVEPPRSADPHLGEGGHTLSVPGQNQQKQRRPSIRLSTMADHVLLAAELLAERDRDTLRIRPELLRRWPVRLSNALLPQILREIDPVSYEARKDILTREEVALQEALREKVQGPLVDSMVDFLFGKYYEEKLADVDLTLEMHWRGIPLRYLGLVYSRAEQNDGDSEAQQAVTHLLLLEMTARVIKCEVRRRWRDECTKGRRLVLPNAGMGEKRKDIPGYKPDAEGVLDGSSFSGHSAFALQLCEVLTFVYGDGDDTIEFFRDDLPMALQQKYGYGHAAFVLAIQSADSERKGDDDDGIIERLGYFEQRYGLDMEQLLSRIEFSLGFVLRESCRLDLLEVAKKKMGVGGGRGTDVGLSSSDILRIQPVVQSAGGKYACRGAYLLFDALLALRSMREGEEGEEEGEDDRERRERAKQLGSSMRLKRVLEAGMTAFAQAHRFFPSDDITLYRWGELCWVIAEVGRRTGQYDADKLNELKLEGDALFTKAALIHARTPLFNAYATKIEHAKFDFFAEIGDAEVLKMLDLYRTLAVKSQEPLQVSFQGCVRVTPTAICKWVEEHPTIAAVDVRGVPLSTAGLEALTSAIGATGTLMEVLLTPEDDIELEAVTDFAAACIGHPRLVNVCLSKVWRVRDLREGSLDAIVYEQMDAMDDKPAYLTPFEGVFAAGLARGSPALRRMSLRCGDGGLGPAGARAAAVSLADAPVSHLNLEHNALTAGGSDYEGARILLRALFSNPSIEVLRLGSNSLGEALLEPSKLLLEKHTLRELRLDSNAIGNADVTHLVRAVAGDEADGKGRVPANQSLEVVDLRDNDVGGAVAVQILAAVKANPRLKVLDLKENAGVARDELTAAEEILRQRQK
uniref:Clu domain-containing protein n=1 Tax=Palpitomonas bilix TaxID=652834 RepID=A0A7S3GCX0_9EUKA|mmetsp:Transcript_43821/g.114294  ORF Transcript_43821/g.114294 Transcript_43821/m.114294 type:complete len:1272 (+) Transcript_43821:140-3955(+)